MKIFRRFLVTLAEISSGGVALSIGLMVLSGLLEGFGLLILIPLLQIVGIEVQQGATGQIAGFVSSLFMVVGLPATLASVLAVYVLINILQAGLVRWQLLANAKLQNHIVGELRQRLYQAVANARWTFLARSRLSDFTFALTSEAARVGGATHEFLSLISQSVLALVYLALAIRISATMTAVACLAGLMLLLLGRRGVQASRSIGEQVSSASRQMYSVIGEYLAAIKTAKSYGAERRHVALFASTSEDVNRIANEAVRVHANTRGILSVGSVLVLSTVLYLGVRVLRLPPVEILLLIFIFGRLVPRFSNLQQGHQHLVGNLPSFGSIAKLIDRCEAEAEPPTSPDFELQLRRSIRFERVAFSYQAGSGYPTIQDLDLVIAARQTTALVGPSGAGKTTVADLVMGLVEPGRGQLLVDGIPLDAAHRQAWRCRIGYVPQDTFLFHDTVRANLLWAKPDAYDSEIWEALRRAAADRFVSTLPEQLDTILGDRGVRLSGGERQRIALARALLRKPSLLILDEATSALDSENERRIQDAIADLHGQITILVITHRLSTVRGADTIYVLEQGRVVESGPWSSLLAHPGGRFRALCSAQSVA